MAFCGRVARDTGCAGVEAVTLHLPISIQVAVGRTREKHRDRKRHRERGGRYLDFAIPTWDARCRGAGFGVVDLSLCLVGGGGGVLLFGHGYILDIDISWI